MSGLREKERESVECNILFYEGRVSVSPTIVSIAKGLAEAGYAVTIFGMENRYPYPTIEKIHDNVKIIYFRYGLRNPLIERIVFLLKRIKIDIYQIYEMTSFFWQFFKYMFKKRKMNLSSEFICIGVDIYGSILALTAFLFFKKKYIYLSLELVHPNQFRGLNKIINAIERFAFRNSEFILIQDEDRFKTLCEYNKYQHSKVFYLPNSAGSTRDSQPVPNNNYFREIFDLHEDVFPHIILQAGMIGNPVFSDELAASFTNIDLGCALIFHDRLKHEHNESYIKKLRGINGRNLFLSLDPLPFEQIDRIFSSATIGLAFYRDIDKNFSQIAKASGKLAYYLKFGKPVLVSNLDSLSAIVEKYKIGLVVKDPSNPKELELAIKTILDNYAYFSNNAMTCFNEEFDFEAKFKPVLSCIERKFNLN